ncbi:integrase catalytic domain-containing protein [Trichonephila clavipes]|nr:integrase catalytic domain-containing protein [Trichonephila clavipes]
MLIPKNYHFTSLIIRQFHRVNFYAGQELVLSLTRQHFWIPHGKSAVKKELRNCIDCFKLVAKHVSQMMCDLPIERIDPCRAFEKVGIDFAEPITTKCQHTCKDYSSSKNVQWHFIPPYALNFWGVWEASVKLTKHHLLKALKTAVLNFEEWSLLMKLKRMLWSCWQLSYLHTLQSRTKWMQGQKDSNVVLIKNPTSFSTRWTPGRIVATHSGTDGICHVVTIQTSSGVMTRPATQVAVLPLPPSTTSSRPPGGY